MTTQQHRRRHHNYNYHPLAATKLCTGFLQASENWNKSGNLSGRGNVGKSFFEKSGKMKNWCHQMWDFLAKMHQIRLALGLRPIPRWGSLQHSPTPLAAFNNAP